MIWYHPRYNGDFRIEVDPDAPRTCILTTVDPTPGELARLGKAMDVWRRKEWIDHAQGIRETTGTCKMWIRAPIGLVGATLLKSQGPKDQFLLTVSMKGGDIEAVYGPDNPVPDEGLPDKEVDKAVTVVKPKLGAKRKGDCPEALANTVLEAFVTPEQYKSWQQHGCFEVLGGVSQRRYLVCHRRLSLAHELGSALVDLEEMRPVWAHDWMVPPPEEALSLALWVQNAEPWVCNEASVDRGPCSRWTNPSGLGSDEGAGDRHLLDAIETMGPAYARLLTGVLQLRLSGLPLPTRPPPLDDGEKKGRE